MNDVIQQKIWSLRTIAAVAVTAVALSGAGGAALAAASDGGTSGPGGRGGFGGPGFGGPPGQNGQTGQVPRPGQQQGLNAPSAGGTASLSSYTTVPPVHRGPHVRGLPAPLPPATTDESRDA